jgi:hypothetical protein
VNLYNELTGIVPKISVTYAKTIINRARADTYRKNLWSFQLFEANWVSPAIINAGTCNPTQGANTVVFDSTASAALIANNVAGPFPTPLTQRQFRVGISTIYNIWSYANNSGTVTLTLDRPFTDPGGAGQSYAVYQCYYPAPMQDFRAWITVRDIYNFNDLALDTDRNEIDLRDPQRTIFYIPTHVLPYGLNLNPASPQYQWPMFELWGQPSYVLTYQLYGLRRGVPLVNDSDTLPPQIGEDCVQALARNYAYEWAEANKGDMPRNQGSDFRFLMGDAMAQYKRLYAEYRRDDREMFDNWHQVRHLSSGLATVSDGFYNSIAKNAWPGLAW